jgi:hypothetical protein
MKTQEINSSIDRLVDILNKVKAAAGSWCRSLDASGEGEMTTTVPVAQSVRW